MMIFEATGLKGSTVERVEEEFEKITGIHGLLFTDESYCRRDGSWRYMLAAEIPEKMIGVMANSIEILHIVIELIILVEDGGNLRVMLKDAQFRYELTSGGGCNGMPVLDVRGNKINIDFII